MMDDVHIALLLVLGGSENSENVMLHPERGVSLKRQDACSCSREERDPETLRCVHATGRGYGREDVSTVL